MGSERAGRTQARAPRHRRKTGSARAVSVDKGRACCQDRPAWPARRGATPEIPMTHSELAWEFAELFSELRVEQINEVLAKNVPLETLDFFRKYADDFGRAAGVEGDALARLPNLLLLGYLLRVLEERLI